MDRELIEKVNNCIRKISEGDREYIEILHELIGSVLYFKAYKYFHNKEESEDLVQDFWMNINTYCSKYRYIQNGYGYLIKTFENSALMKLRQLKRVPAPLDLETIITFEKDNVKSDLSERQIALKDTIERCTKDFTELERKIFALICYEDKTIRQITKEVDASKSTIHRLRQKIMEMLENTLKEDGWDK